MVILIVWGIDIYLYSLQLTTNIIEIPNNVTTLLFATLFILLITQFISDLFTRKNKYVLTEEQKIRLNFHIKRMTAVWLFGSLIDIIFSGGLPIVWAIQGSSKDYTDFGVHSFHGIMNGIYFFLTGGLSIKLFIDRDKNTMLFFILLLLWPILMLGRGILLTALAQHAIIYIFFSGLSILKIGKILLTSTITIIFFGLLGDIRGTENPFFYLINEQYREIFDSIPTGFLWIYIYITSPLSNYAFNADSIDPTWSFTYSIVNLFPSFLRPTNLDSADAFEFVDKSLNVSTIFASSHSDFGYYGDLTLILILIIWAYFWYIKLKQSVFYILPYSIVCCVMIFSVFYNLFFLYPYLFSTILQGFLAHNIYSKNNNKYNNKSKSAIV